MPVERAALERRGSNAINHIGTKAREAPPWWHADLCEEQEHTRLDENQKTKILGKILAEASCPMPAEHAALELRGSNAINHIGTKAREAPPWWHADLCDDHKQTRSDEDQKTTILGKILAEEIHETPGKILAGDDRDATARPLPGARQDPSRDSRGATAKPTSAKTPPPFPYSYQPI